MKYYVLAAALSMTSLNAQDDKDCDPVYKVRTGDVLEMSKPSANRFKHVNMPQSNLVIKKGGIANFKSISGKEIVITKIESENDCTTKLWVKRKDGKKFFNTAHEVTIDLERAVEAGEVKLK